MPALECAGLRQFPSTRSRMCDAQSIVPVDEQFAVAGLGMFDAPTCERGYHQTFEGALQRTGAQTPIVAGARHGCDQAVGPTERKTGRSQSFALGERGQFFAGDDLALGRGQRLEGDDRVQPVSELRTKELDDRVLVARTAVGSETRAVLGGRAEVRGKQACSSSWCHNF